MPDRKPTERQPDRKPTKSQPDSTKAERLPDEASADSSLAQGAFDIASSAVDKIRDQLFLFVIAIVALLIPILLVTTETSSPETRFVITVVGVIVAIIILTRFLRDIFRDYQRYKLKLVTSSQNQTFNPLKDPTDAEKGSVQAPPVSPPIGVVPPGPIDTFALTSLLNQYLDDEELKDLCAALNIDYENLGGGGEKGQGETAS